MSAASNLIQRIGLRHKPIVEDLDASIREIERKTAVTIHPSLREVFEILGGATGCGRLAVAGENFEICSFWSAKVAAARLDDEPSTIVPFGDDLGGNWFAVHVGPAELDSPVVHVDWDDGRMTVLRPSLLAFLTDLAPCHES